ncbi:tRNA guanosine(34) transglycosylase Tgt [Parvibaculum sp.]|uniref:tRNA guanosine(34) transglycosylase Tgt n=1 Tax=Parvibaculum sp. TaxID=2024848 RepID=UPI002731ECBC|nr:tRNA guanosine(34) transglycosylase Tgt [Parvibaculum sp.]MDP1628105.1 tRNA guanosine(34) transglycosylase Tgt [Parvibaculum sp.]MDP2151104.1 tRNA guanosine(34) transglycosylase Tgt [Parvibaculum sp.]MDP3328571.1 tRNA guanosine(34) transglycosylase Tgt [Parvibaculum sp.]
MSKFTFTLAATDGRARTGAIDTPRGQIRTPAFMPVGTAATVKALYPEQVRATGADIVLGNTYHLMLRPGAEEIAALGGLHSFMNWPHPILTDSGGFQVMSLSKLRKMTEEGVTFQSHLDGSRHLLSPERSIEIQCLLGSDIQMQLDECTPFPATEEEAKKSMELSLRWAARSKSAFEAQTHRTEGMALFGIVQGSVYEPLRKASAAGLQEIGFDGYSVGGLAVGEGQAEMLRVLDFTTPALPEDKPRYLMGVGTPDDLVESVARGVDMFDCVMPTRNGRHGLAFTSRGKVNLKNARHAADKRPLDETSTCPAARDYSRAYLHHLIKSGEMLGSMLVSWINVHYYQSLMADMRAAIADHRFEAFVADFKAAQAGGDVEPV